MFVNENEKKFCCENCGYEFIAQKNEYRVYRREYKCNLPYEYYCNMRCPNCKQWINVKTSKEEWEEYEKSMPTKDKINRYVRMHKYIN